MSRNSSKQAQAKGGFTLVELVVVIAVLAILAGVGAVAYNGYIEYAKKGVDRKTVGEINHALELANYSDPSLFDAATTVYLADNGIICTNPEVKSALEDAFGDLSATKLNYLKWKGSMDAAQLTAIASSLGVDGSMVDKYWDNGYSASFAGNIEELWDDVYNMIALYNNMTNDTTNLSKVVNGLTDTTHTYSGQTYRDVMLNAWKSSINDTAFQTFENMCSDSTFKSNVETDGILLSMAVARSCAFKAYAEKLDLSDTARAELEAWNPVPTEKGGIYAHYESYFAVASSVPSEWTKIIDDYQKNGQAEADATAFLGMLEAGKAVENDLKENGKPITDFDYYDALTGYVGITETIMESRENWEAILETMKDSNRALYATVRSNNGELVIHWCEDELNEMTANSDEQGCNLGHTTAISGEVTKPSTGVTVTFDISNISLCSKGGPTTCSIHFYTNDTNLQTRVNRATVTEKEDSNDCITVTGGQADWIITVNTENGAGNATLSITLGSDEVATITVVVH